MSRRPASPEFVALVLAVVGVLMFFFYCFMGRLFSHW